MAATKVDRAPSFPQPLFGGALELAQHVLHEELDGTTPKLLSTPRVGEVLHGYSDDVH